MSIIDEELELELYNGTDRLLTVCERLAKTVQMYVQVLIKLARLFDLIIEMWSTREYFVQQGVDQPTAIQ